MTIRERTEQWESEYLSPYASLSRDSKGRDIWEPPCDIRPVYQRDRDRILHCKSFRRLKHKTQVFLTPRGDHYRTRLTHTLEVSQNARTIAKALRLNEDLTEAIALGHDLGHTPFGHAGERALNKLCSRGFAHYRQSVRVVEKLEARAEGKWDKVHKYQFFGLAIFVGIPLPGTGAWTGALIAAVMDMRMRSALPSIALGVVMAGLLVTGITYGFTSIF